MRYRRRLPAYLGVPNPVLDLHASCYLPPTPTAIASWQGIPPVTGVVLAQGVVASQPLHQAIPGTGPAVVFDQVNDFLGPTSVIAAPATDWSVACCFTLPAALPNVAHYLWGASAVTVSGCFLQGTVLANWGFFTDGVVLMSGEACPAGVHVCWVQKSGATYSLYRDGGALLASAVIVARALGGFTLNCNSGMTATTFGGLAGGAHRVVAWASDLSAADRNLATARLLQEWT